MKRKAAALRSLGVLKKIENRVKAFRYVRRAFDTWKTSDQNNAHINNYWVNLMVYRKG